MLHATSFHGGGPAEVVRLSVEDDGRSQAAEFLGEIRHCARDRASPQAHVSRRAALKLEAAIPRDNRESSSVGERPTPMAVVQLANELPSNDREAARPSAKSGLQHVAPLSCLFHRRAPALRSSLAGWIRDCYPAGDTPGPGR